MVYRIGEDRLTDVRRQGETRLPPVLPGHTARAVLPREIVPRSGCTSAGAASSARPQQPSGVISDPAREREIAGG
jgi:hypothetical protein